MMPCYLVVGLGKTGQSVLRYCKQKQIDCMAYDTRSTLKDKPSIQKSYPDLAIYLKDFPLEKLDQIDKVIASPGVPLTHPVIKAAFDKGRPIIGDVELFAQEVSKPVIAITGTNGKSTVTSMVGDIVKAQGFKVAVCGNIGEPVLDTLEHDFDVWVLELSSFQLDTVHSLKLKVACMLNVAPDHLDRHLDFRAYVNAKKRIYRHADYCVYNEADKETFPDKRASCSSFGLSDKADYGLVYQDKKSYFAIKGKPLMEADSLKVKGEHNKLNALSAIAITHAFGIDLKAIKSALQAFKGLDHRCQWITEESDVAWFNDSKGTNVGATLAALSGLGNSIKGKIIWIGGGQGKGADFTPLVPSLKRYASLAILMGEDKEKIANALKNNIKIRYVKTMDEAVAVARAHAKPGDCVLLSPACASFDMFDSFVHRGDVFMKTVLAS